MRSLRFSTFLAIVFVFPLLAMPAIETAVPALNAAQLMVLRSGGQLNSLFSTVDEITLIPDSPWSRSITENLIRIDPRIGIEALYHLALPQSVRSRPDLTLRVYNILRSISTMQGIEYYSASRERMREFYIESYVIDSPSSRRRTDDPLVASVPANERLYAFQRDSSFGRNVYSLDYRHQASQLGLSMVNLTRMSYGIIPLVGEENLQIHLVVIPTEEGLLFYGICGIRVIGTFGMQDRVQSSFQNRIEAIYGWFSARVTQEFGL